MRSVLVIRLGALGDFFLSFPAFADIRAHHAGDRITLLTTAPFAALARAAPWFDAVEVDARPSWLDISGLWRLRRQLRGFDLVYDLQTSRRSSRYFRLAGRPPWSGIAPGCAFPHANPRRDFLHSVPRQREQLAMAGAPAGPPPALGWLAACGPVVAPPYALLIPGTSAAHGGAKRWPAERFGALAAALAARGVRPVVVGGAGDAGLAATILAACPVALDLTGDTDLMQLAGLAHRAALAVGGDTGPLHVAAMMGCRTIALFSRFSDPALAAPVGNGRVLLAPSLSDLTPETVLRALPDRLPDQAPLS